MGGDPQGGGPAPGRLALAVRPDPARARGLALAGLLAGALALGVPAPAAGSATVRVLVYDGEGPVRVASGGSAPAVVTAHRELWVNGRPAGSRLRFASPEGVRLDGERYRGALVVTRSGDGLLAVNEVELEDYVAGTLPREMYASWNPAALRAQAVVIRSYALYKIGRRREQAWDLSAGARHQVYGGRDAERPSVWRSVDSTRGEYLAYGGGPILGVYHAAAGGVTASAEEVWGSAVPYLRSVPVEGEEIAPDTYWRTPVSRTILGRALAAVGLPVGPVRQVEVVSRSASGRVRSLRLSGSDASIRIGARDLRRALGAEAVRSTRFEVRESEEGFVLVGSGRGHGVGMSQWGAQAMAERGAGYREILEWFYPGTELARLDTTLARSSAEAGTGAGR